MARHLFTSESVSMGHPDKVADQISDAVLDACLAQDPDSRVACETLVTTGLCVVAGEITTRAQVDYAQVARETIQRIGYTNDQWGINGKTCAVMVALDKQSPDISQGVTRSEKEKDEQGAGDQGLMFGFACDETPVLMPAPIYYSHRLVERQAELRMSGRLAWLRPDAKSQVSVRYEDGRPVEVVNVVISTQHTEDVRHGTIEKYLIENVIKKVIDPKLLTRNTEYLINPTGRFVIGGPQGDSGLTGRKIIVDTDGGWGRHGGGAFSGKDPSKVDRSAAYMGRWVAKTIVAAGLAEHAEIQFAYAIGHPQPVSVHVNTFGTAKAGLSDERITAAVQQVFSFKPADIVAALDLKRPIYRQTTNYGHFGKPGMPWESTTKVAALKAALR